MTQLEGLPTPPRAQQDQPVSTGPQAGPVRVHRATALQRPLELVPRQVLPDGGLGAGGISQFPPDHLREG